MIKKIKIQKGTNFKDKRGLLWTSWKKNKKDKIIFNHDKFSISKKKVLRGLHYDNKTWKLISCVYGKVFFVVVDCRKKSKNFLKTFLLQFKEILKFYSSKFCKWICLSKECFSL